MNININLNDDSFITIKISLLIWICLEKYQIYNMNNNYIKYSINIINSIKFNTTM